MNVESDLSKLARWAIPGWIAILCFYLFVSTDILFSPPDGPRLFTSVTAFVVSMLDIEEALKVLLVATAGIPIGFVIYQIYFFFRWNSPFARDGLLVPLFQGRMSDIEKILRDIGDEELIVSGSHWRGELVRNPLFERDHAFRWRYIELLFLEASQKIDSSYPGVSMYARHRYLHEVMHTLGVSIFAVYFGFGGYFLIKITLQPDILMDHILFLLVVVWMLFSFLHSEETAKDDHDPILVGKRQRPQSNAHNGLSKNSVPSLGLVGTRRENPLSQSDGIIPTYQINLKIPTIKKTFSVSIASPAMLSIFLFASIHLMGNPYFNMRFPSQANLFSMDFAFRLIVFFFAALIWILSRKNGSTEIRLGDFFQLSLIFASALLVRVFYQQLSVSLDWPYLTVIFIYLALVFILVENRQNSREELTSLEYFTLRRYLDDNDVKTH